MSDSDSERIKSLLQLIYRIWNHKTNQSLSLVKLILICFRNKEKNELYTCTDKDLEQLLKDKYGDPLEQNF